MKNKEILSRALPSMPREYHEGLINTLSKLNKTPAKRLRHSKIALIAALLGALLIAGCAIALRQSGVLDYLFYRKTPPKEAVELVQTVGESTTSSGVSITVDDYAYDGKTVAVSYTLTCDGDDTLIIHNDGDRDLGDIRDEAGNLIWGESGWGESGDPIALGGTVEGAALEKSKNFGQKASISPESQTLTLTVHANVYRPLVPLALSDKTAGEGDALVIEYDGYSWESAKNNAAVDAWHKKEGHGGDDLAQALVGLGWIEKIGEVSFTKTLEPSVSASNGMTLKEPIELEVGDDIITIEYVNFSPLTTEYRISVGSKPGAKNGFNRWWEGALLDAQGDILQLSGGAAERVRPDGLKAKYIYRYGRPFTSMPTSFVLCPLKEGFDWDDGRNNIDIYDHDNAIRLKVENGVIVAPEKPDDRKVVYAADFTQGPAGTGEILSAKPMDWEKKTLSQAFAGGGKLPSLKSDPGYFKKKDGTTVSVSRTFGELFYHSGKLSAEFVSYMMMTCDERNNAPGELAGFSSEEALGMLDETLGVLGLRRGRIAYMFKPDSTGKDKPKDGYYITFSLNYNGLDCILDERPTYSWRDRIPAASGMSAFVNPDGVMYMQTLDFAAIYETASTGESITPISFDTAKSVAEKHLSRGEAGETVEIKRAFYEYMPVWTGENKSELTLRPVWSFYAQRNDKALYPLVYVDAEDGEIRY